MADQNDRNRSFTLDVNFSGIEVRSATRSSLPPGIYAIKVDDCYLHLKKDDPSKSSVAIECGVTEGEFKGVKRTVYVGTDFSKEGNRRTLKTALVALGLPSDKLVGAAKITVKGFMGKKGHLKVTVTGEGKEANESFDFIIPAEVDAVTQMFAQQVATEVAVAEVETVEVAPVPAPKAKPVPAKPAAKATPAAPAAPAEEEVDTGALDL